MSLPARLRRRAIRSSVAAATVAAGAVTLAGLTAPAANATTTTWSKAVANGTYEVTIKHPTDQPKPGVISVTAEGKTVFEAIDFQWDKTFTVVVTDGVLNLSLEGPTDLTGFLVYPMLQDPSTPTPTPTGEVHTLTWSEAVTNGSYQVTLKRPTDNPAPGRVTVVAEGKEVLQDIDLAYDKSFDIEVTDGTLNLSLTGTGDFADFRVFPLMTGPGADLPPAQPQQVTPGTTALGPSRSGLPWLSGVRPPGQQSLASARQVEGFRGRPLDAILTYGRQDGYTHLANEALPVTAYAGFEGRLVYSLPLIPWDRSGSLAKIAAGEQDSVWRAVAKQLADNGRGNSIVRVGWEYNIPESPWYTTAQTADVWKAAFRRVVTQMRPIVPNAKFEFGLNCGNGMAGSTDRLAPLKLGYPGDDVVDIVGCDGYDWWQTGAKNEAEFQKALRPTNSTGFGDIADFAKAHNKLMAFGEWGLTGDQDQGNGDNPFYLIRMFQWFRANASMIAVESYFDDPQWLHNSLAWGQLPVSAEAYRALW